MKKLLFAFPIVALLAAGCNSSQQAFIQTPVPTPVVQNNNPSHSPISTPTPTPASITTPTNPNAQTYTGSGFTFQYPSDWVVSSTGNPSQNPTSCGDAWGDASSCVNLDPLQLAKNMANTITVFVFNTNTPLQGWCQSRNTGEYGTTFSNCQLITINGNSAIIATSPLGETPEIQYQIISGSGTLIMFQTANSNYQSEFNAIVNSIRFTK